MCAWVTPRGEEVDRDEAFRHHSFPALSPDIWGIPRVVRGEAAKKLPVSRSRARILRLTEAAHQPRGSTRRATAPRWQRDTRLLQDVDLARDGSAVHARRAMLGRSRAPGQHTAASRAPAQPKAALRYLCDAHQLKRPMYTPQFSRYTQRRDPILSNPIKPSTFRPLDTFEYSRCVY